MRGSVQGGHFIPPSPIVPEKQDVIPHAMPTATPAYAQAPAQQAASQQQQTYVEPKQQTQAAAPASQGGLVLRPPVPGAHTAERKKSPSLFERITGVGGFGHSSQEAQGSGEASQGSQGSGSSGGFHSGLRAERTSEAPSQGQLNIDSPAASRAKSDEDLDIPAFLRRQAN
jgi:cell division protein FtsZ